MKVVITLAAVALVGLAACSSSNPERTNALHDAMSKTQLSLSASIAVVEQSPGEKMLPTRAVLVAETDPRFSIFANGDGVAKEVQIDKLGKILSANPIGALAATCPGATSLKDAVGIAEGATGGTAFQIQPDDDDACFYEVQTLAGSTIWEVKIDRSGNVVSKEDATGDSED